VQLQGKAGQSITLNIAEGGIRQTLKTDGRAAFSPLRRAVVAPQRLKLYVVRLSSGPLMPQDRIGFRTIQTRGQDILLNGKPIFMRGISIHDEKPVHPRRTCGEGTSACCSAGPRSYCNMRLGPLSPPRTMLRLKTKWACWWAEVPCINHCLGNPATRTPKPSSDLVNGKTRQHFCRVRAQRKLQTRGPRLKFMTNLIKSAASTIRLVAAALELNRNGFRLR
jgi:beta-glucuronidase